MNNKKFDVSKLERLNIPERIQMINFEKILNELNLPDHSLFIDIGAGTGAFSQKFLNLFPTAKCICYDISQEMITWIKENRIPLFKSRLKAQLMSENKIPLDDNKADFAFMIAVHHELNDSQKLLKDVHRALKDKGQILICDWKKGVHSHFFEKEQIINDLKETDFINIKELNASEKFVCLIGSKSETVTK